MRLKLVSEPHTQIVNSETGEPVHGINSVQLCEVAGQLSELTLRVVDFDVDFRRGDNNVYSSKLQ